jgi:PleD family two-component response regulator
MNVLIIDDDGDDRDLFCEVLREVIPTANCLVAESGEQAIKFLRDTSAIPDYIFLDVYMHGMDGKECLLKIKSIKRCHKIPVIMYSSLDDQNLIAIFKKLGANGFICKPSNLGQLREMVTAVIKFPGFRNME